MTPVVPVWIDTLTKEWDFNNDGNYFSEPYTQVTFWNFSTTNTLFVDNFPVQPGTQYSISLQAGQASCARHNLSIVEGQTVFIVWSFYRDYSPFYKG
jgi:hypothetical protein